MTRLRPTLLAVMVTVVVLSPLMTTQAAGAAAHALVNGSGSSWAENAVNQWVADVNSEGIQVVYNPDGDAQGRQDFANGVSDFSVTSDGYQGKDPVTGVSDTSNGRPYVYLPIAAGGTSFPYQIKYDGQQVENLRLSGQTLAKIFTNQITNWDDPEITKDNNGHALPSLPITPVVQSEGSGATQQLTSYFATEFPSIWQAYSGQATPTEYFPEPSPTRSGPIGRSRFRPSRTASAKPASCSDSHLMTDRDFAGKETATESSTVSPTGIGSKPSLGARTSPTRGGLRSPSCAGGPSSTSRKGSGLSSKGLSGRSSAVSSSAASRLADDSSRSGTRTARRGRRRWRSGHLHGTSSCTVC